tara:strand:+ start:1557 stop:1931 length:375 start_codon:yes stop_codon:yes gene_type:complete
MNIQKRRNFRHRPQKNNFRSRSNGHRQNNTHFQNSGGNNNFNRNGSMSNPFNVEKVIQKFKQLAKDAQSVGDPILVENYLQHADHYVRRLSELNLNKSSTVKDEESKNIKSSSEGEKNSNIEKL